MLGVTAGDHVAEIRKYWWRNVQEQWIPRILSPHFSFSNMNFIFPHPFKTQFSGKGNIFHVKLGLTMRYTISQFTISEVRIRLGLRAVHVKPKNYVCFELWSTYLIHKMACHCLFIYAIWKRRWREISSKLREFDWISILTFWISIFTFCSSIFLYTRNNFDLKIIFEIHILIFFIKIKF